VIGGSFGASGIYVVILSFYATYAMYIVGVASCLLVKILYACISHISLNCTEVPTILIKEEGISIL